MIIECPACGARAKLPDSKEGAKVRCAECERVYLARASGRGAVSTRSSSSSSALPIGIGAAVVAVILIVVMMRGGEEPVAPTLPTINEENLDAGYVDETGWDSALVRHARAFHDFAYTRDEFKVQNGISMPHVWARMQSTDEETVEIAGFDALTTDEVQVLRSEVVQFLLSDDPENHPGSWKPFDGGVVAEDDTTAVVRLQLQPRSEAIGNGTRNIEWHFVKIAGKWKAWSWERWYSPEELKADRIARKRKVKRTTLSDGSQVIEAEAGAVPYMDSTPQAMRDQIDGWIKELVDLELPAKRLSQVRGELELAGKDAIPPLLTAFFHMSEAGFDNDEAAAQGQLVHSMLGDITGYVTTFKAHAALGGTDERRDSGVRQWFGWYQRKFKKFEGRAEEVDLLEEGLEFSSEKERREYEKYKRQIEQEEKDKASRENNG